VFFEHEKILRHYRQNVALSNFYGIPAASQATKSVNVKALSFLTKLKKRDENNKENFCKLCINVTLLCSTHMPNA